MARVPSRRSLAAWLACGFSIWSCGSGSGPGPSDGRAGSGQAGAALAGSSGNSTDMGGMPSAQAGVGQGAGAAGLGGNGGSGNGSGGGSDSGGHGGLGAGGTDSAGRAGASEGGAGGVDSVADGRCGQGFAAGSSAVPPKLDGTVTPKSDASGNWSFSFGRYRLVVAGGKGAKVIEFSIDGNNLIDATGGSTFWPSPQQNYTWPVPPAIDSAAYTAQADATSLGLTSAVATLTGSGSTTFKLSVHKRFWVNANSGVVSIEYQLTNEGKESASWAPWELTRVRAGGYTFAPRGPGERIITQDSFQYPLPVTLLPPSPAAGGIEWLNYPSFSASLTKDNSKDNYIVEFDGAEGWLAHANRFGNAQLPVLFVKSFVDAPDESLPDNQAEIQIWTSGTADPKLIEVEEQGALQVLAPGASLTWTVHWSACELPSSSLLAAGNADLAALARAHAVKH